MSSQFPLSWVDDWFPSPDGIRAKEFRAKFEGPDGTASDGILTDHKKGASAQFAPRAGEAAGERSEVKTKL